MVARKVGAVEAVTPSRAGAVAVGSGAGRRGAGGPHQIELVVVLAAAAVSQGDDDGWHTYTRRAVDMLGPDTDPLLASRAYSALGLLRDSSTEDSIGAEEAIRRRRGVRRRLADRGAGAGLWPPKLSCTTGPGQFASRAGCRRSSDRGRPRRSPSMPCSWPSAPRPTALGYLGTRDEACATGEQARRGGAERWDGRPCPSDSRDVAGRAAVEAGRVARGKSIARAGYDEALAAGFRSMRRVWGDHLVPALTWEGRLGSAEHLLEELRDLGLVRHDPGGGQAELCLARGDVEAAARVMPERAALDDGAVGPPPRRVRRPPGAQTRRLCATTGRGACEVASHVPRLSWRTATLP